MSKQASSNKIIVTAPSNIALIKYWGKKHRQLAQNPSISFTLKNSLTNLSLEVKNSHSFKLDFLFNGIVNKSFSDKIFEKLSAMFDLLPWIEDKELVIESANTFPHSAGIASSASSMAALAFALTEYEGKKDLKYTSSIARILSGSACRSVSGPIMIWGEVYPKVGHENFAVNFNDYHEVFKDFKDSIIIVDSNAKNISSTQGHGLMNGHPYADARYLLAHDHSQMMLTALKSGDLETFGHILEQEALGLHGLMMTSDPSFILIKPQTIEIILNLKKYREKTKAQIYFTLDAGPNLHLLYPAQEKKHVDKFLEMNSLTNIIHDELGTGVKRVQ